ncbi:MAG: TfoX/Sxy family protein [Clostridia bacterium]|nr:TfoX/Sxy family protein [Clostridia bacterium]
MASSKEYINFILEQCSGLSARAMMGEYVLYYGGKVVGGVYDNRLLVKPTPSAKALMPSAEYQLPYEGAKEMLLVENIEDRAFLRELLEAMCDELPETKKRK